MKHTDLCSGLPFLCPWGWTHLRAHSPCVRRCPYVDPSQGHSCFGHLSGSLLCYHWLLIWRHSAQAPKPECPLRWPHLRNVGNTALAAHNLAHLGWVRSSRFHINVSPAFSSCLSVTRLVPGEHPIARWTLIPECSEREGSFSSFEDSAPL